jgi:hypothetical protein
MRAWLLGLAVAAACASGSDGAKSRAPEPAPQSTRPTTTGVELVAALPPRADAVLELDVARLRGNAAVGPLLEDLRAHRLEGSEWAQMGFDPVRDVDVVVAAAYGIGGATPRTVFLVRGERLDASAWAPHIAEADALDEHTLAIGPRTLRDEVVEHVRVKAPGLLDDAQFVRLRDIAMPKRAPGAVLRLTARLGKEARIDTAGRLGLDEVPAMLSAWLDVADDAAMIMQFATDDAKQGKRLADGIERLRRLGTLRLPAWLAAQELLSNVTTTVKDKDLRITWVVGPRRLADISAAVRAHLEKEDP